MQHNKNKARPTEKALKQTKIKQRQLLGSLSIQKKILYGVQSFSAALPLVGLILPHLTFPLISLGLTGGLVGFLATLVHNRSLSRHQENPCQKAIALMQHLQDTYTSEKRRAALSHLAFLPEANAQKLPENFQRLRLQQRAFVRLCPLLENYPFLSQTQQHKTRKIVETLKNPHPTTTELTQIHELLESCPHQFEAKHFLNGELKKSLLPSLDGSMGSMAVSSFISMAASSLKGSFLGISFSILNPAAVIASSLALFWHAKSCQKTHLSFTEKHNSSTYLIKRIRAAKKQLKSFKETRKASEKNGSLSL